MDKNYYRKTEFSFVTLVENLYGSKEYKKVKNYLNITSTKRIYLKILKSIRFAVLETIKITDKKHKEELLFTLDEFEKNLQNTNSIEEIDQKMISFQSQLLFLIIGFFPRRLSIDSFINKSDMWNLNLYRQISFTQTSEQKKNLIFKAAQGKYLTKFGSWHKFISIYHRECDNNPAILVEWIRKNHPDIYLDLF